MAVGPLSFDAACEHMRVAVGHLSLILLKAVSDEHAEGVPSKSR